MLHFNLMVIQQANVSKDPLTFYAINNFIQVNSCLSPCRSFDTFAAYYPLPTMATVSSNKRDCDIIS